MIPKSVGRVTSPWPPFSKEVLAETTNGTGSTTETGGTSGGSSDFARGADPAAADHGCGTGSMVGLIAGLGLLLRLHLRDS